MRQIVLSPKAKEDLSQIWDLTLAEWGIEQAEKYIQELWTAIQKQAQNPTTSTDISDVRDGYRKARSGSHIFFFKVTDTQIDVVRILHQRMDFERHI